MAREVRETENDVATSVLEMRARLEDAAASNLCSAFAATVSRLGGEVALRGREGPGSAGASWTWDSYADVACRVAGALDELGLRRGERVALMLRNRPEFHAADMGTMLAGGTTLSDLQLVASWPGCGPPRPLQRRHSHRRGCVPGTHPSGDGTSSRRCATWWSSATLARRTTSFPGTRSWRVPPSTSMRQPTPWPPRTWPRSSTPRGPPVSPKACCIPTGPPPSAWRCLPSCGARCEGFRCISYGPMAHIAERSVSHYVNRPWARSCHSCHDLVGASRP